MAELRVSVVPVGKLDPTELETVLTKVSKVLGRPLELRVPAPVSRTGEDTARGQHQARPFLGALRAGFPALAASKLVGAATPTGGAPAATPSPDAIVFVTDVDLFTPATEGVFGDADPARHAALVSVRRLRESFYRRKADPPRQRARLGKEILRAIGKARGLPDCGDAGCAMAPTAALADLDRKAERYCSSCHRRLSTFSPARGGV